MCAIRTKGKGRLHCATSMRISLLLFCVACIAADNAGISLSSGQWTLSNRNGTLSLGNVSIPGYALEHLQAAGHIGKPLYRCPCSRRQIPVHALTRHPPAYGIGIPSQPPTQLRMNELEARWVAHETWTYSTPLGIRSYMPDEAENSSQVCAGK